MLAFIAFFVVLENWARGGGGRGKGAGSPDATYFEQTADDGEDYDCEDGNNDAISGCAVSLTQEREEEGGPRGSSPAPCVEGGNDGLHGDGSDRGWAEGCWVDMEMAKTPTVVVVGGVSQLVYESGNG